MDGGGLERRSAGGAARCSAASQRQRLQARGLTDGQIDQRIAAQWPVQKKMDLANHVVWTESGLDTQAAQLERVFKV